MFKYYVDIVSYVDGCIMSSRYNWYEIVQTSWCRYPDTYYFENTSYQINLYFLNLWHGGVYPCSNQNHISYVAYNMGVLHNKGQNKYDPSAHKDEPSFKQGYAMISTVFFAM